MKVILSICLSLVLLSLYAQDAKQDSQTAPLEYNRLLKQLVDLIPNDQFTDEFLRAKADFYERVQSTHDIWFLSHLVMRLADGMKSSAFNPSWDFDGLKFSWHHSADNVKTKHDLISSLDTLAFIIHSSSMDPQWKKIKKEWRKSLSACDDRK
jgi:hypothetical protein